MMGKLGGKIALVTGAGRGIGRAIAIKLASEGANLVINDMDDGPAQETLDELRSMGAAAATCIGSITEPNFAEHFVGTAVSVFGGLDIVVNNAGYTWDSVIQKTSDEQWYAMLDVHLTAPFRILRAAQPVIRNLRKAELEEGASHVRKMVNISSMAGLFGNVGQTAYATAKSGLMGMTQTLAKEWGRLGVTVNCVAFGLIKTRLTADAEEGNLVGIGGRDIRVGINPELMATMERTIPLGRAGTPEDAAGAVLLFCLPESDYVSGQTLMCSGGLTGL